MPTWFIISSPSFNQSFSFIHHFWWPTKCQALRFSLNPSQDRSLFFPLLFLSISFLKYPSSFYFFYNNNNNNKAHSVVPAFRRWRQNCHKFKSVCHKCVFYDNGYALTHYIKAYVLFYDNLNFNQFLLISSALHDYHQHESLIVISSRMLSTYVCHKFGNHLYFSLIDLISQVKRGRIARGEYWREQLGKRWLLRLNVSWS